MKKLVINYSLTEKRYASLTEAGVDKITIQQPQQQSSVGHIYFGTVTKVLPGMNAVFVDIGEEKNGFLYIDKLPAFFHSQEPFNIRKKKPISSFVHQGEKLFVQVEKDETGDKGPRLSGLVELHGEYVIYMPTGNTISVSKKIKDAKLIQHLQSLGIENKVDKEGFIFRTAVIGQSREKIVVEIEKLREQYQELVKITQQMKKPGLLHKKDSFVEQIKNESHSNQYEEIVVDDLVLKRELESFVSPNQSLLYYQGKENIFSFYHLEQEIEQALQRRVDLDNGAYIIIDETEAMTVIDVNTGGYSGKSRLADTVLQTNLAAAIQVAKQLRLRDIGGIVLIDFIDMKNEHDRLKVQRMLEQELNRDEKPTKVLGFTSLGVLGLTRKKTKQAISEALTVPCPVCSGTGKILSPETIAFRLERELWDHRYSDHEAVWIESSEDVRAVFSGEKNVHLFRLQEMLGLSILFSTMASLKPFYQIRQFGRLDELQARIEKV
ncbi:Rne/Rng family ribonuclease [Bacillus sp. T3]|uniref:Rne/Rng family ribonuclease n=1 Tax=Bacillus sp. T3 TaxID=467262 RepID=UPI0029825A5B|nr:Rne/Rng family ribonuclease [Bacillus sp. T3]